MLRLAGNSINNGLFIGRARHVVTPERVLELSHIVATEVDIELQRLQDAISAVEQDIDYDLKHSGLNHRDAEIIASHRDILHDPDILGMIRKHISEQHESAMLAVQESFSGIVSQFENMQVELFAAKATDYRDVGTRLLNALGGTGITLPEDLEPDQVLIYKEMTPSLITKLAHAGVRAYLCAKGSYNSHSSILSRALNIVAIANIPMLTETIKNDDALIVDGDEGKLIVDPDEETMEFYVQKIQVEELLRHKLERLKLSASQTKDKRTITLYTNIGLPEELDSIQNLGCDGIGLFRTEFLYLSRRNLPSEDEQFEIYRTIAERLAPTPITIRTFDLGGDKLAPFGLGSPEDNPYLGNRGIRFSLMHKELFHTQLRAILRASAFGKIKIMFPMVLDVEDFKEAKQFFNHCQEQLYSEGVSFDSSIALGSMNEIPSAALEADSLARECDFLSIGTNDLVQYTLAVDRNNEHVSRYYIQHHPAVLSLIRHTILSAAKFKTPLSVCGEMASLPQYVPLLIGMGITELSVNPLSYFRVKSIIQNCDAKLGKLISRFNFSRSVHEVEQFIYNELKNYYQVQEES